MHVPLRGRNALRAARTFERMNQSVPGTGLEENRGPVGHFPQEVRFMEEKLGMMEAVEMAMAAEKKAQEFYAEAAGKVVNERGRNLLQQLARFEQSHYEALAKLLASLRTSGAFLPYAGTGFAPFRAAGEVAGKIEPQRDDALSILQKAIEAETEAYERYRGLASRTTDPHGKEMFEKLAAEELLHRRILNDEFYYLSNRGGIWFWGD
ncbi:MAG: ferritin family protein [candidate division KSB1 bacterium]|nr:ferritin family protein [candidate division KSB1 bacterium]MDZ7295725.1 ferritin family protein [candidate division KSB1 bacterium]